LEQRLESASTDFRALKSDLGVASTILLVVAAANLSLGVMLYLLGTDANFAPTSAELAAARFALIGDVLVSLAMAACFLWAQRAPTAALTTALGLWLAAQGVTVAIAGPMPFALGSLWILTAKVITFALLLRGIVSAASAARVRAKLARPRPAALPNARVIRAR
jgi:hypothetical protein